MSSLDTRDPLLRATDNAAWRREIERAVEAERERCAKIVEAEPELPGEMPSELNLYPLQDALRATVRVTKKNIAAAIRAA